MTKKKMSLKRPDLEKAREAFVREPEERTTINRKADDQNFPWQQEGVTERVIIPFNLRLPEPTKLKLEWIVKNSLDYRSMHDLCMSAIIQKIDDELEKLT